jgi:hypothetical protein
MDPAPRASAEETILEKQRVDGVQSAFEYPREEHELQRQKYEELKSESESAATGRHPDNGEIEFEYLELLDKYNKLLNDYELERQKLERLRADHENLELKYDVLRTDYAVILPRYESLKGSDTEKLGYQALIRDYELEKHEHKIQRYEFEYEAGAPKSDARS